jgi:hypothetical protein
MRTRVAPPKVPHGTQVSTGDGEQAVGWWLLVGATNGC